MNNNHDAEILSGLGKRIRQHRVQQNIPLEELARRAGLSKTTLSNIETGTDFRLSSLIRILRVLGRLNAFDAFLPTPLVSPLDLLEQAGPRVRQRARRPRAGKTPRMNQSNQATPPESPASLGPLFEPGIGVATVGVPAPAPKPPSRSRGKSHG